MRLRVLEMRLERIPQGAGLVEKVLDDQVGLLHGRVVPRLVLTDQMRP
jgi:hypothetical protein